MKRLGIAAVCLIATALLGSCNGGLFGRPQTRTISVSAGAGLSPALNTTGSTEVSMRAVDVVPMTDEQYFKADRQSAARGERLYQLSPESFVLDMDVLVLYNEVGQSEFETIHLLGYTTTPDGAIIPKHIDLAYADDFVRDVEIQSDTYHGLSMQFLPTGSGGSNDGYYVRSITGLTLPPEYDGVTLQGEISGIDGLPSNLRYFGFDSLQPFETNTGFLSYLTIGSNVAEDGIQNPEGLSGQWINPVTSTSGNSVSLYFATGDALDFSPFENPEIVFLWDLSNLVEIWDSGTSDPADDIVTYGLSNPFPVSIQIRENDTIPPASESDNEAPGDVIGAAISGPTTYNTLQWINPRDSDFKEVVVVRKVDSAPADMNDGEEVYRSYQPNYVDVTGAPGTHYYYRVATVDYSGNSSGGVLLDQVQP